MGRNRREHGVFGLGAAWLLGLLLAVSAALAQAEPDDSLIKPLVDEALYSEIVSELKLDDFNTAIAWALYEEYRAAVRVISVELSLSPYPKLQEEYQRWMRLKQQLLIDPQERTRSASTLSDPVPPERIPEGYGPEPSREELDAMYRDSANISLAFHRRADAACDELFERMRQELPVARSSIDTMERLVYRRLYLLDPTLNTRRADTWLLDLAAIARDELVQGVLIDVSYRLPRDRMNVSEPSFDAIIHDYEIAVDVLLRRTHERLRMDKTPDQRAFYVHGVDEVPSTFQQNHSRRKRMRVVEEHLERIAKWAEERGGVDVRNAWLDRFNQLMFPHLYRPLWIDRAAHWFDELDDLTENQRNSIDAILAESLKQRNEQRRVVCRVMREVGGSFRMADDPVTDADRRLARAQLAIHRTTRNCLAAVRGQLLESQRRWLDDERVYIDRGTPDSFGPAISRSVLAATGELDYYTKPLAVKQTEHQN